MHHFQFISQVGQDGLLQVQLPPELNNCEVEVVVVVQRRIETSLKKPQRILGAFRGKIMISEDFSEPLPESFWLGEK